MGAALDGYDIAKRLIEAGIIPKDLTVCRVVIDIRVDSAVKIFYETCADEIALDICLESLIANKEELSVKHVSEIT